MLRSCCSARGEQRRCCFATLRLSALSYEARGVVDKTPPRSVCQSSIETPRVMLTRSGRSGAASVPGVASAFRVRQRDAAVFICRSAARRHGALLLPRCPSNRGMTCLIERQRGSARRFLASNSGHPMPPVPSAVNLNQVVDEWSVHPSSPAIMSSSDLLFQSFGAAPVPRPGDLSHEDRRRTTTSTTSVAPSSPMICTKAIDLSRPSERRTCLDALEVPVCSLRICPEVFPRMSDVGDQTAAPAAVHVKRIHYVTRSRERKTENRHQGGTMSGAKRSDCSPKTHGMKTNVLKNKQIGECIQRRCPVFHLRCSVHHLVPCAFQNECQNLREVPTHART